ncbi:MAG: ATPase [Candidatus Firestonebacteria bacterium RIFOXYC2_FULL_39_67]|nr:MAG: ATPase [Candidatus Firestonebacteria bacterium RIFOXYD2_FULL_39_29]OGF55048.1 MAG: ATPase [Candidatus Firestonebacteria bacterium RifOxyC12_full_39_7]OGF56407.1 MAG: ATPase [Candidatus Firestonebacteria bacterium RIFOXYC2_FULL_39_67]
MEKDIKQINEMVKKESAFINELTAEIGKVIVGQQYIISRMLIGMLADGHILIEGVPGLAKTLSVKTLSSALDMKFQRIQFTPDLLPADLTGTLIFNPKDSNFSVKKGPIFTNLVLADEINRAPAKVQSALLEAMQESQVTIGDTTYPLPSPFLVIATQNPIEQEGTYPLPEAQVDRFMLKLKITYPNKEEENQIIERMSDNKEIKVKKTATPADIIRVKKVINDIYVDEKVKNYVLDLVFATREPEKYKLNDLKSLIAYGASPRASIYFIRAAKALAFINGRGYVTPEDIKLVGADILRHRVIVTYEAEAEEITSENIIKQIFDQIEVP